MVNAIPKGFHTVTPMIFYKDSRQAIDFYTRALDAKELFVMTTSDGKRVTHATISIGDATLMMGDESPSHHCKSAKTIGDSPVSFYVYLKDVDAAFKKAVSAGAKVQMPVQDMFYGDRIGAVKDPFGMTWTLATHIKDPSPEELKKGVSETETAMARKPS